VLTGLEPLMEAMAAKQLAGKPALPVLAISLESSMLPLHMLSVRPVGALQHALEGTAPLVLAVKLEEIPGLKPVEPGSEKRGVLRALRAPLSAFVDFYEAHKPWVVAQRFGQPG
jgi:hypothetical protein